jgi:hypothetical protein
MPHMLRLVAAVAASLQAKRVVDRMGRLGKPAGAGFGDDHVVLEAHGARVKLAALLQLYAALCTAGSLIANGPIQKHTWLKIVTISPSSNGRLNGGHPCVAPPESALPAPKFFP